MSRLVISRDHKANRWSVFRLGEFARYVASFDTLLEAEQFVLAQSCPDVEEPT